MVLQEALGFTFSNRFRKLLKLILHTELGGGSKKKVLGNKREKKRKEWKSHGTGRWKI